MSLLVSTFCGFSPRASRDYSPSQARRVRSLVLLHPRYMHACTICRDIYPCPNSEKLADCVSLWVRVFEFFIIPMAVWYERRVPA